MSKSRVGPFVAIALVIGLLVSLWILLIRGMPASGEQAVLVLLGALSNSVAGVVGFYFGSSASSRAKDDALVRQIGDNNAKTP